MKNLLSALTLCVLVLNANAQCPNPVAKYLFDGNATDFSGNAYHGTISGATPTTDRFGVANAALMFNGNEYVNLPDDFDFAQRTISMWFNATNITTTSQVLYESDHNGIMNAQTDIIVRDAGSGDYRLYMYMGLGANNETSQSINANTWYHLAITRTASKMYYYLNCELVDSAMDMTNSHSTNGVGYSVIGASRTHIYEFVGKIDDVRIFDCALSATQLNAVCTSPSEIETIHPADDRIALYPNPTEGIFTVLSVEKGSFDVTDASGRVIITASFNVPVDLSFVSSGMYFIRTEETVIKLIIE